jgi:hypothetical protein
VSHAGTMSLGMQGLRFLLIVALTVLMDLGSPILPETSESLEEYEEAAHGRRRVLRHLAHVTPPPAQPAVVITTVAVPSPAWRRPPRRSVAAAVRKLPPLRSDPAAASDDH